MSNFENIYEFINRLNVAPSWKDRFKRIHTSYMNNYYQGSANNVHIWRYVPAVLLLPAKQRFNFFTSFNIWAFLLGPFYYVVKLMYKKAIILTLLLYFLATFNAVTPYIIPFLMLYCAIFANRDYFRKMVLNNPAIKAHPDLLSNLSNEEYFASVVRRKNYFELVVLVAILLIVPMCVKLVDACILEREAQVALTEIPQVCTSQTDCTKFINENLYKISMSKSIEKEYQKNYKIACAYAIMGNKNNAIKFLDLAIKQNPKYLAAYLTRASYQHDNQNYLQAIENYKSALEIAPRAKFLNYYIGRTYYKIQDYENAKGYLELAVKSDSSNPLYLETLGYTKVYLRDNEGAVKDLKRTVKLYKQHDRSKNILKTRSLERYITNLEPKK